MKIVIREWLKYKSIVLIKLLQIAVNSAQTLVQLLFVKVATKVLVSGELNDNLMTLIGLALLNITALVASRLMHLSKDKFYTNMYGAYTDAVINAEYDMYTDISCSAIVTASNKMHNITVAGCKIFGLIDYTISIVITIIMIWDSSPQLVLLSIPIYVATIVATKKLTKMWGAIDNEIDVIKRRRNHELDSVINGFQEVRSYQTENFHSNNIHSNNAKCYELFKKRKFIDTGFSVTYLLTNYGAAFLCIIICTYMVANKQIDTATALTLYSFIGRLINPLSAIIDLFDEITANISVLDDYDKIMSYENKMKDGSISADVFEEGIEFKNVSFKYKESGYVLQNVNMTIPKGSHIGICGTSGCGKSSLFKLIEKFYEPCEGSITIDGIDFREVTNKSLRSHMAVVSQDPYIFDGTVKDNLLYGSGGKSIEKVKEICQVVGLDNFIKELPEGLDTKVGPRGLKLSGGQCQRIAFARALLRDAEILLLDEATSALDNVSEMVIQNALNKCKGLTIVTIAHRLTTIKDCDRIYVFHGHTVADSGTHDELMKTSSVYQNLVNRSCN